MFLDCPAWLDQDGAARCGLPAEVRCRFTMCSTDGPVESAMIRCPAGHYFCGAIESLTWHGKDKHDPGSAQAVQDRGDLRAAAHQRAHLRGQPEALLGPAFGHDHPPGRASSMTARPGYTPSGRC